MITYEKEIITWEKIVFTEENRKRIEENFDCHISANDCNKDGKIVSYILTSSNNMNLLYIGDTVCYDRSDKRIRIEYKIF